jgi:hypothetical protein
MAGEEKSQPRAAAGIDKRHNFAARQAEGPVDASRSEGLSDGIGVIRHTVPT